METILRSELASRSEASGLSADEKRKLHNEMAVCEEKRQALALLLLHYCAGLQHAEQVTLRLHALDTRSTLLRNFLLYHLSVCVFIYRER